MAPSDTALKDKLRGACAHTGASFAILWVQGENGEFQVAEHHDQQIGGSDTYCTKSADMKLPQASTVGKVYQNRDEILIDVASASPSKQYIRASLAHEFGLKSLAFSYSDDGVLELGTQDKWETVPKLTKDIDLIEKEIDLNENPARNQKLTYWEPENTEFWNAWGSKIAFKNLWISIPQLCLGFATWLLWSILVTQVQKANDEDSNVFPFSDWPGMDDKKTYKAQLSMLPALAGMSGATLRVVNSFMVSVTGGQCHNAMNSTLTIIPMLGIGVAFASNSCPFWLLCILAASSGFGGGAFASSMSSISFFFPKNKQGLALGLNAGFGNLGVSLTQLLIPPVCSLSLGIGDSLGSRFPTNGGWFYAILLAIAAIPAWSMMNYMPAHGSPSGSMCQNIIAYLRLELLGFVGVAVSVGLFLAVNPMIKGNAVGVILRIVALAVIACLTTLAALWYLSSAPIKAKLRVQSAIFYNKHTWATTWLYIMTFGSFIGYSSAFPKLIKDVFGYLPDGSVNPNAPSVAAYSWMGACLGSLARPLGGWLSDKLGRGKAVDQGGAIVTHWGTIIEIAATVAVGVFVRLAMGSEKPEDYFVPFLLCFLVLFTATGSSNGSTFRQISVMFPPEQAGPVLGWTSAVAAYGAAIFPACFGAGVKGGFADIVLFVFAAYYATCLAVNYYYYYRSGAEKPC